MNKFLLIAALAHVESRTTPNGTPVFEMLLSGKRIVTDKDGKERHLPFYVRSEALGKAAENLGARGYRAGDVLMVDGSADYQEWEAQSERRSRVKLKTLGNVRKLDEAAFQVVKDASGNPLVIGGLNRVTLIGNLAGDVDVKTLESGDTVANVRIAVNEKYKDRQGQDQERTHWFNVSLWRHVAESVRDMKKGQSLFVEGALGENEWTDKDGGKHRTPEITAELAYPVVYLPKPEQETREPVAAAPTRASRERSAAPGNDPGDAGDLSDLPF